VHSSLLPICNWAGTDISSDVWSKDEIDVDRTSKVNEADSPFRQWIQAMPKAELHVHLEGSIRVETAVELADANASMPPALQSWMLGRRRSFNGFDEFADLYLAIVSTVTAPEDLARAAYEFGERMHGDGTVYAEVTWTPQLHVCKEHPFEAWLEALNDGRRRAEQEFGVTVRWVIDICRDRHHGQADVVSWATSREAIDGGVVALGLGGTETHFPPHLFTQSFRAAREAGLKSVPHAGEHKGKYAGASSVWGAIEELKADRIGHGNRAIEDPLLMQYMCTERTPLELCPSSNIKFGLYENLCEHPLRKLIDAGCFVTINTDDPEIFDTSLTDELYQIATVLKLSRQELATIIENSFVAACDKDAAQQACQQALRIAHNPSGMRVPAQQESPQSAFFMADSAAV
jgi:aminodeoxyfutalosine deaminase